MSAFVYIPIKITKKAVYICNNKIQTKQLNCMKYKKWIILAVIITVVGVVIYYFIKNKPTNSDSQTNTNSGSASSTSTYTAESFPLKQGMQGANVGKLQTALKKRIKDLAVDNKFGVKTLAAVRTFWNQPTKTEVSAYEVNYATTFA